MRVLFRRLAERTEELVGSPWAFVVAVALLVGWAASGPFVGFSPQWHLWADTAASVVIFLIIVLLIQNTQTRPAKRPATPASPGMATPSARSQAGTVTRNRTGVSRRPSEPTTVTQKLPLKPGWTATVTAAPDTLTVAGGGEA